MANFILSCFREKSDEKEEYKWNESKEQGEERNSSEDPKE